MNETRILSSILLLNRIEKVANSKPKLGEVLKSNDKIAIQRSLFFVFRFQSSYVFMSLQYISHKIKKKNKTTLNLKTKMRFANPFCRKRIFKTK